MATITKNFSGGHHVTINVESGKVTESTLASTIMLDKFTARLAYAVVTPTVPQSRVDEIVADIERELTAESEEQMARKFNLTLSGERNPIVIVADTDEDAMAQVRELKTALQAKVVSFFEVFEMPRSFNQQFNNIFGA